MGEGHVSQALKTKTTGKEKEEKEEKEEKRQTDGNKGDAEDAAAVDSNATRKELARVGVDGLSGLTIETDSGRGLLLAHVEQKCARL